MNILEKMKIIEEIVPKDGARLEVLGKTSLKITHACGCVFVEHFHSKNGYNHLTNNFKFSELGRANRRYFVELCHEHDRIIIKK